VFLFCWWGKYCNKRVVVAAAAAVVVVVAAVVVVVVAAAVAVVAVAVAVVVIERSKSQYLVQHTIYVNELQYFAITMLNLRVLSKQGVYALHIVRIETPVLVQCKA